jgi:hypothetical protein
MNAVKERRMEEPEELTFIAGDGRGIEVHPGFRQQ